MREAITRRDFLKLSGAGTAALGLSGCVGSVADPAVAAPAAANPLPPLSAVDRFNYVVGTQTIGASYQFTDQPRLVETAQAIREMGSSVIKLKIAPTDRNGAETDNLHSLREVAANDPTVKQVLTMPFTHYVLWAYPFGRKRKASDEGSERDEELYDLCCHLLQAFRGTCKTFYLGHWEGDWELRGQAGSTSFSRHLDHQVPCPLMRDSAPRFEHGPDCCRIVLIYGKRCDPYTDQERDTDP